MTSADFGAVFSSTRDTLREVGVDDEFFRDLLTTRLFVERVGESDNMGWWESRVLSETGRVRLAEVAPKTTTKSRIDLALKIGRKAESGRLPNDALSLFSFGPQLESRLSATIDEVKVDESVTFDALEDISVSFLETKWTAPIIEEIRHDPTELPNADSFPTPDSSGAMLLADHGYSYETLEEEKRTLLVTFLRGYGTTATELHVPYYNLESEIEAANASGL